MRVVAAGDEAVVRGWTNACKTASYTSAATQSGAARVYFGRLFPFAQR